MTGAILMLIRPDRMIMSAWRGEARKASKPKRAMSMREPTMLIISIAQQASPKVSGKIELPRAHETALSSVVVMIRSWTYALEVLALEVAAQHVARPQLAHPEVVRGLLPPHYLHSRAPLRQTYTRATSSSTMKTTVSTRAKVPNARSWIATG